MTVPAPSRHRPEIQGLRGIAVLLVLAFHADLPLPGGFVGVDVFFVISGYVITLMLAHEAATTGAVDLRRFMLRRILRLLPSLIAVVLTTVLLTGLILSPFGPQQTAAATGRAALLFFANQSIAAAGLDYFAAPAALNPLLHTWSLAVEEQFYLVFPVLLTTFWALVRRFPRLHALPLLGVLLVLFSSLTLALVGNNLAWPEALSWLTGFYSPLTRAWQFAVGAVLALTMPQLQRLPTPAAHLLAVAGTSGLLLAALLINETTPFPGWWALLPTLAAAVLISAALHPSAGRLIQWLSTPWLRRIGDRSYALYLWHWPAVVFLRLLLPDLPAGALIATLLSVPLALLSYRLIEQPLRHTAAANLLPAAGRILAASAATVAVCLAVAYAAAAYWQPLIAARDPGRVAAQQRPLTLIGGCQPSRVTVNTVPCRWNADATGRPLYLLGDSNAGQHAPGLIAAATELGRPLSALATSNCLPIELTTSALFTPDQVRRCSDYTAIALAWLAQQPAGTVLISQSDRNLISGLNALPPTARPGEITQLRQAMLTTVRHL